MAKLAWVVICQRALVDQTNNASLIQILEEISVPPPQEKNPSGALIPIQAAVVTGWRRSNWKNPERFKVRIRLFAPDKKSHGESLLEVDLEGYQRSRCIAELPGIPYFGAGIYAIRVEVLSGKSWRKVGEADFTVRHNELNLQQSKSLETINRPSA
jgi:hypothetical protein